MRLPPPGRSPPRPELDRDPHPACHLGRRRQGVSRSRARSSGYAQQRSSPVVWIQHRCGQGRPGWTRPDRGPAGGGCGVGQTDRELTATGRPRISSIAAAEASRTAEHPRKSSPAARPRASFTARRRKPFEVNHDQRQRRTGYGPTQVRRCPWPGSVDRVFSPVSGGIATASNELWASSPANCRVVPVGQSEDPSGAKVRTRAARQAERPTLAPTRAPGNKKPPPP